MFHHDFFLLELEHAFLGAEEKPLQDHPGLGTPARVPVAAPAAARWTGDPRRQRSVRLRVHADGEGMDLVTAPRPPPGTGHRASCCGGCRPAEEPRACWAPPGRRARPAGTGCAERIRVRARTAAAAGGGPGHHLCAWATTAGDSRREALRSGPVRVPREMCECPATTAASRKRTRRTAVNSVPRHCAKSGWRRTRVSPQGLTRNVCTEGASAAGRRSVAVTRARHSPAPLQPCPRSGRPHR